MNLIIETTEHGTYYEVKVKGEIDVYTAPELQEELQPLRSKGTHDIHLNISEVSYMDSTGLGLFVGTLKELNKSNHELHVYGANPRITRLFEITGLKELMHVTSQTEAK